MRALIHILGCLLLPLMTVQAQSPADWWYFGDHAGVHFNSTGPAAVTNGQLLTHEGCASISDYAGNLLFYTDGTTVYDALHNAMANGTGLMGSNLSTQSAVIVPYPGQSNKYFIFTVPSWTQSNVGLRYSVVDMTLNSGLGDVVANAKNVFITAPVGEKITAAVHANGQDYWVLTLYANAQIHAFHVSSAGVNTSPTISTAAVNFFNGIGYMKISPDATKAAIGLCGPSGLLLTQFDNMTGMLNNVIHLGTNTFSSSPLCMYGVEFSPNSQLVYAASDNTIWQLDVSVWNQINITGSLYTVSPSSANSGEALQLGPDLKIYNARPYSSFLGVINNPNVTGVGCNYNANAIPLLTGISRIGLPGFVQSIFIPPFTYNGVCVGDTTFFAADSIGVDSIYWDFGDPNSGTENTSASFTPWHIFTDTGTFEVMMVSHSNMFSDTNWQVVHINPHQSIDLGPDTALCVGLEVSFSAMQPYSSYLWSTGSSDSAINVTNDSVISVTVFGVCDTVSDTVNIDFFYPFTVDLDSDTNMCLNASLLLSASTDSTLAFSWSTGNTGPGIQVIDSGEYSVTVSDGLCSYSDTVYVGFYPPISLSLGNDSMLCYQDSAILQPQSSFATLFSWSTGETTEAIKVSATGTYTVTASDGYCYTTDSVEWQFIKEPFADLGNDTSFCNTDTLTLITGLQAPVEFLWNNGSTGPSLDVGIMGLYWVEVNDDRCSMRDTIIISQYPELNVSLGEDRQGCVGDTIELVPASPANLVSFLWNDGSMENKLLATNHATYAITVSDGLCQAKDAVNVFLFEYPAVNLGPDTSLCHGTELTLDVTSPWAIAKYLWRDGSDEPLYHLVLNEPIQTWVQVTNVVCTSADSVLLIPHQVPEFYIPRDTVLCPGSFVTIGIKGDTVNTYRWSSSETGMEVQISKPGEYHLSATDGKCTETKSLRVRELEIPSFSIEAPEVICIGEHVTLEARTGEIQKYRWQDGTTHSSLEISQPGIYYVEAYHPCALLRDTAQVLDCECFVRLPSAFHPDGDGKNDLFGATGHCQFEEFELSVYDRWGELIFRTNTPEISWDGTYDGIPSPPGTYAWRVFYKDSLHGTPIQKQGMMVLLR